MNSLFPHFPVFLDLAGRAVIILGDEPALIDLAQTCLSAGAGVSAFCSQPSEALRALSPSVRLWTRRWRASDFRGARLIVAGASAPLVSRARIAAHAAGALFHATTVPNLSDVTLGGVTARGALSIGVSAPGAPEALAAALRDRIEAALPHGLADFLSAAAASQDFVLQAIPDAAARDAFWAKLAAEAFMQSLNGAEAWSALIQSTAEAQKREAG
jgi:siroheme synthase-like protein